MKNIVLFASGTGTNAENIVKHFAGSDQVSVKALFCNNANAAVIEKMKNLSVPVHVFDRKQFTDEAKFGQMIDTYQPDLIILAGFLWLIPAWLIHKYPKHIVNIHPALLPAYGGKGMFGHHVHEAVLLANEKHHGITIHFVNENYDEGQIIFQAKFDVETADDLPKIQSKIASLEMRYYPEAIRRVLGL